MKKSTVGMLILGSVIFTKAFVLDGPASDSIVSRDNTLHSNVEEALVVRDHSNQAVQPVANQITAQFNSPSFKIETHSLSTIIENEIVVVDHAERLNDHTEMDYASIAEEEILPMDYVSNTGYGMWKSSEEKIRSKEERKGDVPLDRGNTISDNISKLFPRTP